MLKKLDFLLLWKYQTLIFLIFFILTLRQVLNCMEVYEEFQTVMKMQ